MAKAPTSYGYPGSINSAVLADWLTRVAGARFSVGGKDDLKVSVQTGMDRGIRINAGIAVGDSVMDVFPEYDTLPLPTPSGSFQWFLIVIRRNWSTPASTNFAVIPGTAARAIPASGVRDSPGQESDQAIALVRVQSGNTVVQDIVDLRAWSGNGGVEAADALGREQLARPGAAVKVGADVHRYEYTPANGGSFGWKAYPLGGDSVAVPAPSGWATGPAGFRVDRMPLADGKSRFFLTGQLIRNDFAYNLDRSLFLGTRIPAGFRPPDALDFHAGLNNSTNNYVGAFDMRVMGDGTFLMSPTYKALMIEKFGNLNFSGSWVA